jgi:hypothetical protein
MRPELNCHHEEPFRATRDLFSARQKQIPRRLKPARDDRVLTKLAATPGNVSHALGRVFHQFEQHAAGARGMHEHVKMPASANLDLIRDQARAVCL